MQGEESRNSPPTSSKVWCHLTKSSVHGMVFASLQQQQQSDQNAERQAADIAHHLHRSMAMYQSAAHFTQSIRWQALGPRLAQLHLGRKVSVLGLDFLRHMPCLKHLALQCWIWLEGHPRSICRAIVASVFKHLGQLMCLEHLALLPDIGVRLMATEIWTAAEAERFLPTAADLKEDLLYDRLCRYRHLCLSMSMCRLAPNVHDILAALENIGTLTHLDFSGCRITDERSEWTYSVYQQLGSLGEMAVEKVATEDNPLTALSIHKGLRTLILPLMVRNFTKAGLRPVLQLKALEHLQLSGAQTPAHAQICQTLTNLQQLSYTNPQYNPPSALQEMQHLVKLTKLVATRELWFFDHHRDLTPCLLQTLRYLTKLRSLMLEVPDPIEPLLTLPSGFQNSRAAASKAAGSLWQDEYPYCDGKGKGTPAAAGSLDSRVGAWGSGGSFTALASSSQGDSTARQPNYFHPNVGAASRLDSAGPTGAVGKFVASVLSSHGAPEGTGATGDLQRPGLVADNHGIRAIFSLVPSISEITFLIRFQSPRQSAFQTVAVQPNPLHQESSHHDVILDSHVAIPLGSPKGHPEELGSPRPIAGTIGSPRTSCSPALTQWREKEPFGAPNKLGILNILENIPLPNKLERLKLLFINETKQFDEVVVPLQMLTSLRILNICFPASLSESEVGYKINLQSLGALSNLRELNLQYAYGYFCVEGLQALVQLTKLNIECVGFRLAPLIRGDRAQHKQTPSADGGDAPGNMVLNQNTRPQDSCNLQQQQPKQQHCLPYVQSFKEQMESHDKQEPVTMIDGALVMDGSSANLPKPPGLEDKATNYQLLSLRLNLRDCFSTDGIQQVLGMARCCRTLMSLEVSVGHRSAFLQKRQDVVHARNLEICQALMQLGTIAQKLQYVSICLSLDDEDIQTLRDVFRRCKVVKFSNPSEAGAS